MNKKAEVVEIKTEESLVLTNPWDDVKPTLEKLEVEDLKGVIEYCQNLIDEMQKEEVESLEAEMREIQDKLMALKGKKTSVSSEKRRMAKSIVNPANLSQVYTFGRYPEWLEQLVIKTGKSVAQLRDKTK